MSAWVECCPTHKSLTEIVCLTSLFLQKNRVCAHRASAAATMLELTLGMGLRAILKYQHQCHSVWTDQLKSMYSFQSINADADTRCE